MAEKRMFSKMVIDSDLFTDMPHSAQVLYFHLAIHADDDGFVNNPRKIQRIIDTSDADMAILYRKGFVIPFSSGICVIAHWRIHNYVQKDRYKETIHTVEKSKLKLDENKIYVLLDTECIQFVSELDTDCTRRLDKNRLDKSRLDIYSSTSEEKNRSLSIDYQKIIDLFNRICTSFPKVKSLTEQRRKAIKVLYPFLEENGGFQSYFERVQASDYLCGRTDTQWNACFDWIFKRSNAVKILEGNYDNRSANNSGVSSNKTPDYTDTSRYENITMEV